MATTQPPTITLLHPDRIAEEAKLKQKYGAFVVLDPKGLTVGGRHYAKGVSLAEIEGLGAGTVRAWLHFKQIGLGGVQAPVVLSEHAAHHAMLTKDSELLIVIRQACDELQRVQGVVEGELAQIERGEFTPGMGAEEVGRSIAAKRGWLAVNASKISEYRRQESQLEAQIRNLSAAIGEAMQQEATALRQDAEAKLINGMHPHFPPVFLVGPVFEKMRRDLLTNTLGFQRAAKREQRAISLLGPYSVGIAIDQTVSNTLRALEGELKDSQAASL